MTTPIGAKVMPTALRLTAAIAMVLLCLIQSQSQQVMAQELDLDRILAASPTPQPVSGAGRGASTLSSTAAGPLFLVLSCAVTLFLGSGFLPGLVQAATRRSPN